jgi:nucleoside 2-deoxyribosyltransferase
MPAIYLASPLGFALEHKSYLERVKTHLLQLKCLVFDPWSLHFGEAIREASQIENYYDRVAAFARIARDIGAANESELISSEILLAVLDGTEVDSGTAAEVGFAAALGKKCYGLRTDWRDSGDFIGLPVNLQVLWFIERSGGRLFRRIEEIIL